MNCPECKNHLQVRISADNVSSKSYLFSQFSWCHMGSTIWLAYHPHNHVIVVRNSPYLAMSCTRWDVCDAPAWEILRVHTICHNLIGKASMPHMMIHNLISKASMPHVVLYNLTNKASIPHMITSRPHNFRPMYISF